ncbi:MAG: AmmeMemoRadiSam system radical SAM enzyme [Candidatus Asgardarchaeia archaeon]
MIKEATAPYSKLDGKVRCELCPRSCILSEGQVGFCGVRKNVGGKIYSLNYGLVTSMAVDPIEKKPLFHFWPGEDAFSISTMGCNLGCLFCQNWQIARAKPGEIYVEEYSPEYIVELAKRYNTKIIAYTYNEPIIWYEFVLDTAKIAKREGLYNVLVTNGYITIDALKELAPFIDAANVDVKAFTKDFYSKICMVRDFKPILDAIVYMKEHGVHVEITNLKLPGLNDSEEETRKLSEWILDNLGPDVPLHITRFYPHYKMLHLDPTPVKTLVKSRKVALETGLNYIYTGNVPGDPGENTYCPKCGEELIVRYGFHIVKYNLSKGKTCPKCGNKIPIVGRYGK